MADKEEDKSDEEGKKKGLPPVVMIAVGALLGGAGVVFGMPAPAATEESKEEEAPKVLEVFVKANPMTFNVNPRSDTGKFYARVKIRFFFQCEEPDMADAKTMLKENWAFAESEVRKLLRNTHRSEWETEEGVLLLEHEIRNELTYRLFPGANDGEHQRIAEVKDIIWDELVTQ